MSEEPKSISKAHLAAARAVDQLRRQLGVVIAEGNGHAVANYPIESIGKKLTDAIQAHQPRLLITAARAKSLGLGTQALKCDITGLSPEEILTIADPLCAPSPSPTIPNWAASDVDLLALKLAKHAALLPALLLFAPGEFTMDWPTIDVQEVKEYFSNPMFDMVPLAKTALPLETAENVVATCWRERYGTSVHLALVVGDIAGQAEPLVRVHSSCVTGDILGSLRCDCGDQLQLAIRALSETGGILLYLHQEGRGIGLANKLRAYQLQERGVDTYEANRMLGFEEDERDFSIAGAILKKLGISAIKMLTNNPQKMAAMEKAGIRVAQRVPLIAASGKHNHGYLEAKEKKAGHLF